MIVIDIERVLNDLDDAYTLGDISRERHDDIYNYLYYCTKPIEAIPVQWINENYPIYGGNGTEKYLREARAIHDMVKMYKNKKEEI